MGVVSSLIAGTIGTAALIAGGGAAAGMSVAEARKKAQADKEAQLKLKGEGIKAAEYAAGAPGRAGEAAQEEIRRQRRIRALAGGKTILTSEAGTGKTLLG